MTRKTVMHRETEVFVVEERLAPRKEAIKRRVKLERCIAAGINLGAMILTGGALVKIGLMVFAVIDSRTGGLGGEVLVFPALAMMFLWGREIGLGEARQKAAVHNRQIRGYEWRTSQTILQRAADPGSKGSVELGSF